MIEVTRRNRNEPSGAGRLAKRNMAMMQNVRTIVSISKWAVEIAILINMAARVVVFSIGTLDRVRLYLDLVIERGRGILT